MAFPIFVPDELVIPPPQDRVEKNLAKHIVMTGSSFTSFSYQPILDSLMMQYLRKHKGSDVVDLVMIVKFQENDAARESGSTMDVMKRGICLDGSCYRFLGHTDCQLAAKTCFLMHDSELAIYDYLEKFADFTSIVSVSKRSEYMGNLFVGFDKELTLKENDYFVIDDIKCGRHNFSRGCGYMNMQFAAEVKQVEKLQYLPSVVKVVYQGFFGTFALRTDLNFVKVEFRNSMKKFNFEHRDLFNNMTSVGVLDFSRPYTNGYLGPKDVMLLADGGVSRDYLSQLQDEYYSLLENLCTSKTQAAYYLQTTGREDLLRMLNSEGLAAVKEDLAKIREEEITKIQGEDIDKMESKPSYQASTVVNVLVPKSRLVMGVCDPYAKLEHGQCHFSPTLLSPEEQKDFAEVDRVVVFRESSYYPGDVIVLRVVRKYNEDLGHLKDCIVFPATGSRPHALECGGGDLARDKFFVSWDPNLIPQWRTAPFSYGPSTIAHLGGRIYEQGLQIRFREKTKGYLNSVFGYPDDYARQMKMRQRQELAQYFASFDSNLPYKFESIFMKYASALGPSCKQCRHLHRAYFRSASSLGRGEELERVMSQYENEYKNLLRPESKPKRCCIVNKLVNNGWIKPFFDPGDDIWNSMGRSARGYLLQLDVTRHKEEKGSEDEESKKDNTEHSTQS
ncbi:hypothetical protein QZH41_003409 [Actinostola sp. cb2023]|nr:hypothetical protein QZH41_003409 [Actinostola sp. cb2023]